MVYLIASLPPDPLRGANVYHYEVGAIWIAVVSLCMVALAFVRACKNKTTCDEAD
jgi:hypothetical protein